jgi:hypothetical protein
MLAVREQPIQVDLEPAVAARHPVHLKGLDAAIAGALRHLEELRLVAAKEHELVD